LSLGETARRLGVSKHVAQRWCRAGRLRTRRAGLRFRVSGEDVEHLVSSETSEGK
jgi:excisionase family DNA binding protein